MKASLEFDLPSEESQWIMASRAPDAYKRLADAVGVCESILCRPDLNSDVAVALNMVLDTLGPDLDLGFITEE